MRCRFIPADLSSLSPLIRMKTWMESSEVTKNCVTLVLSWWSIRKYCKFEEKGVRISNPFVDTWGRLPLSEPCSLKQFQRFRRKQQKDSNKFIPRSRSCSRQVEWSIHKTGKHKEGLLRSVVMFIIGVAFADIESFYTSIGNRMSLQNPHSWCKITITKLALRKRQALLVEMFPRFWDIQVISIILRASKYPESQ